jgi:hypothetical protein
MSSGRCEHTGSKRILKIFGGVALALVAAGIISQLHDIRRYIKMVTM